MPSVKMRKIVQVGIGAVDYQGFYGLCFRCTSGMRLRTASRQGERLQTPKWRRVTATALTGWIIMWTAQTSPALLVILYHCIFENRGQRFLLPQLRVQSPLERFTPSFVLILTLIWARSLLLGTWCPLYDFIFVQVIITLTRTRGQQTRVWWPTPGSRLAASCLAQTSRRSLVTSSHSRVTSNQRMPTLKSMQACITTATTTGAQRYVS